MTVPGQITLDDLDQRHHEVLAALREAAAVAWVPAVHGWVVTTRAVAVDVMRDPVTFTVDDPRFSTAQVIGPSMLSLDGVEHARHRGAFADSFRPAEIGRRYTDAVNTLSEQLVTELQPRHAAELRRDLAGPLAVAVVVMALGIDDVDPSMLLQWYDCIVAAVDAISRGEHPPDDAAAAFAHIGELVRAHVTDPDSVLHAAARTLSDSEVIANAATFMFGGIETSEGMITNLFLHLLEDPEQWDLVRSDPTLIDDALEESLRLEPAVARVDRYATAGVTLAGARIAAGDLVVVSLAAANRDPAVFTDPDRFDLRRRNARQQVAFAQGPHACIGAQLARLETRAAVRAVLERLPGIELVGAQSPNGIVFRKAPSVHVKW